MEVLPGAGIVSLAADHQDLPEHGHGMFGQVFLTEEFGTDVVVPGNVPTMDGVLVAKVRKELGHGHLTARPGNHRIGLLRQHGGNGNLGCVLLGLQSEP